MTVDEKKKMLLVDYRLHNDDFYISRDEFGDKLIIRRAGIDKIQAQVKMKFDIESMIVVPYGQKVCVTILGRAELDGLVLRTVVHVNPDNCKYPNYAEVAEKRCRHRLLLQHTRLYEHHIFSEIESEEWMKTRNNFIGAVDEVKRLLDLNAPKNKQKQALSATGGSTRKAPVAAKSKAV